MKISVVAGDALRVRADLVAVPVATGEARGREVKRLSRSLGRALARQIEASNFRGEEGQSLLYQNQGRSCLLLGMGKRKELSTESWRRFGYRASRSAADRGARKLACYLPEVGESEAERLAAVVAEGVRLASYKFDRYKSDKSKKQKLSELVVVGPGLRADRKGGGQWRDLDVITKAVFLARDLVNEPASVTTPTHLAELAKSLAKDGGLKVEVWDKKRMAAEKLNGTLAVAGGSKEEPRFIQISYSPAAKAATGARAEPKPKKIALVGKGITFDSGGLSLKPAKSMESMKTDMAGAATVLGVMSALPKLKPMVEVTAYVPATENLPGGGAQKPGDVITYMNGKSVEVLNTDAEGRLILADALCYACRQKPDVVIDLATLTGACMVALGVEVAGVMGNDQSLVDRLIALGTEAGEALWQLPLVKDYREDIKGTVGDIKNIGTGYGGTITAGLFLQEFVDCPSWVHVDIAGPSFVEKDFVWASKGGTGFGVRTLLRYLLEIGAQG